MRRAAFTLVEMLVVIAIIVALAALALVFLPKREVKLAADGAAQLQTYIASAKSRALRDGAPRGVRLIPSPPGGFRELQYIEVPESYGPLTGATLVMTNVNYGSAPTFVAQIQGMDVSGAVAYGDFLDFMVPSPGHASRVSPPVLNSTTIPPYLNGLPNPQYDPKTNTTYIQLASIYQSALNNGRLAQTDNYRFIRQPRPLLGEPTLQLPNGVLIDPAFSLNLPLSYDGQNVDILFSQSGEVINATGGRVVLWVRDDNNVSAPTLLCVYTHTGGVAAHPISQPWNPAQPVSPTNNPYAFTQDGKSSGQ